MRLAPLVAAPLAAAFLTGAAVAQTDTPVEVNLPGATATLIDASGANQGRAVIRMTPTGLAFITISATGLPQGWHAVHVHETGECDAAGGFESAGGHLGHMGGDGTAHGFLTEGGPHAGDLPNQMVQADGTLVAEIFNERLTMGMLFDDDGSAFIIHADRDDYQSQPSGAAGSRLMCGVIERDGG